MVSEAPHILSSTLTSSSSTSKTHSQWKRTAESTLGISSLDAHYDNIVGAHWNGDLTFCGPDPMNSTSTIFKDDLAILSCKFLPTSNSSPNQESVVFGGLGLQVNLLDVGTCTRQVLGTHSDSVSSICALTPNMVVTGSWDTTIKVWDPRQCIALIEPLDCANKNCPTNWSVDGKVFALDGDANKNKLIVGTSRRSIEIYDLRSLGVPLITKQSPLRHSIRHVAWIPDSSEGYVVSNIEGRVAVEYFNDTNHEHSYAFKCHRHPSPDNFSTDVAYPVNAIRFAPNSSKIFFTGGGDGTVAQWDLKQRKRLKLWQTGSRAVADVATTMSNKVFIGTCAALNITSEDVVSHNYYGSNSSGDAPISTNDMDESISPSSSENGIDGSGITEDGIFFLDQVK